uniref:Uncharacterized protein n=1 Tax=Arcella intermedia TaxID=1963864 RepID=A0A6B2L018_9EUKA
MKTYTRDYIMKNVINGIGPVKWGFKVLILDTNSCRFVDSAIEMKEITKAGVSDVCIIDKPRMRLPKLDAIYFVAPTAENIEAIINDFDDGDEPQYRRVHLFFTSSIPMDGIKALSQGRVMARIKTLKEVNLQYLVYDSILFHFDAPKSFFNLYSPLAQGTKADLQEMSDRLASVLAILGEYPFIRSSRSHPHCSAIASMVHEKMEQLRRDEAFPGSAQKGSTLLILDRTHDLVSPVFHDLFYQSMIEDILSPDSTTTTSCDKIHGDVYCHKFKDGESTDQTREVILNEKDPIWREIRNMHIEAARIWITSNFKKFREEHKEMGEGQDITKQLRSMPKFQALRAKFAVHISLAKECMDVYNRSGLENVCSVEQDLATGLTDENKKVSLPPPNLKTLLSNGNISKEYKLRLLMLYYIANPKPSESRSLEQSSMLTDAEEKLLNNWIQLKEQTSKTNQQRPPLNPDEWEYVVSRFTPQLHDVILSVSNGTLPTKEYPFLNKSEENEVRTTSNTSHSKKKGGLSSWTGNDGQAQKKNGPRIFVFIAGGISYSELRAAHRLTQKPYNLDIILGSTHIIDPPKFLKQVAALSSSVNDPAYKSVSFLDKNK